MKRGFAILALVAALAADLVVAAGAPATAVAAPRTWHLVALGDSIPFGGRYCGGCAPYPTLLASDLSRATGHPVRVTNLGVPGLTTAQLLANVRTKATVRAALAAAEIVTITIGHNDTPWNSLNDACDGARAWFGPYRDARWATYTGHCLAVEAAALGSRLRGIQDAIRMLRGGQPTLVELTTDWNQVIGAPGIGTTARAASKAVLDRFASVTCAAAKAWSARCADVYAAFNGSDGLRSAGAYLAADHDHASQLGHQKIADLLAVFGAKPLT